MEHGHPIRVVAKKTGMSPQLIRMWERRYGAVAPSRTPTGRRLYTDDDIERLVLLHRATMEGQTISQIAGLSPDQLRKLAPKANSKSESEIRSIDDAGLSEQLDQCIDMVKNLDAVGLETRLLRASVSLGHSVFIEKLLYPLLELTGEMWYDHRLEVAHEHLASAVIRSLLGNMYLSNTSGMAAPLLLSTTPQGQLHEFGALMASVTASTGGWRTLYLGPNLPAEDIADTAMSRNADAIALSIVYPPDDPNLELELGRLRQLINSRIKIIAGGRSALSYGKVLDEIGAIRVVGLSELRTQLIRLKSGLRLPSTGTA